MYQKALKKMHTNSAPDLFRKLPDLFGGILKQHKPIVFLLLLLAGSVILNAQTGYIYVHSKTLNEAGSPDISFSVSGGVPGFTLNDAPAQTILKDIGSSENGRLWAVGYTNGALYYRNASSPNWVNTGITNVNRVDGGPTGTCFYITTAGTVFSYTGSGAATQISAVGQFPSGNADIGSGWTTTPYIVNNTAIVYKYSGSGTTWNTYTTLANNLFRIDVNPTNGNVYIGNAGGVEIIQQITPALGVTSLGTPATGGNDIRDIGINENGEIYVTANNNTAPGGWYVHKFSSGTTWVREASSFDGSGLTGGLGNSLWLTMNSGGWANGSGWTPAAGPYPFYNIFARGYDGTTVTYIDDERVRTSPTAGNSQFIAVAPGTYTITETVPGGWDLQKITIYDPTNNSSSNQVAGTATITVAANEVVNVVFQTGELNPFPMTNSCDAAYLETFGKGTAIGSYGSAVTGQTSYHYLAGTAPGEDGHYKMVTRANPYFNTWSSAVGITDHTPDDAANDNSAFGYMYAVNAGYDKGEFFRRRFTGVKAGASYNFSAWIVDLTPSNSVNVSFLVLDHSTQAVIGSYNTGLLSDIRIPATTIPAWQQFGFTFTTTSTDIDLVIGNNGIGGNGNDLAIDDISFEILPVSVPVTTVVNAGCGTPGSITVLSPVGASFEYSKDNFATAGQTSPVFSNLTSGSYTISVRFIGTTGCVNSKTEFVGTSICGNIWNDVNGNAINSGENPITSGVWVNLVDPLTNDVIQSVQVDATGSYSFTGLTPNTNYKVILSSSDQTGNLELTIATIPTGYVTTGTNLNGVASTANKTGIITVNTGTSGLTQQNFGMEQPPVAVNNTGTGTIASPVTINILTDDSDPSGTSLHPDSLSLILPAGATNPVYDAQGDLTGFVVPGEGTWSYNSSTGATTFTPAPGYTGNPTPITYTVTDLAGVSSNVATVTITYPSAIITGTVFDDANGSGTITAGETGTTAGTNLYVYLINSGGIVIDSAKVNSNGIYTLYGTPNTAYTIELSMNQYPIGTNSTVTPIVNALPTGWVTTGEGAGNTNDLTPNGTLSVTSGALNTTTSNNNFGIEQLPDSYPRTQFVPYPTGGIIPAGVVVTPVSGNDPEDGTLDNDNTFVVTKLPVNAMMVYAGTPVAVGQQITNFNPALLSFTGITAGSLEVVFEYAFIDAAGKQDPSPAKYTLTWAHTSPLPITLESFTATASLCNKIDLAWKVSNAINFSHFEVERSTDGANYQTKGLIMYDPLYTKYAFTESNIAKGNYQYRLKQVDTDGKSKYSHVVFVKLDCGQQQITVYPNPASSHVTVSGLKNGETIAIYSTAGEKLQSRKATGYQENMIISGYASGIYYLVITDSNGVMISRNKISKVN